MHLGPRLVHPGAVHVGDHGAALVQQATLTQNDGVGPVDRVGDVVQAVKA
jgi:hypothetical protein